MEITYILFLLWLSALECVGFKMACEEGMILGRLAQWLENRIGPKAVMPLFRCTTCMASVHGTIIWLAMQGIPIRVWLNTFNWIGLEWSIPNIYINPAYPVFILALAGLNTIVGRNLLHE